MQGVWSESFLLTFLHFLAEVITNITMQKLFILVLLTISTTLSAQVLPQFGARSLGMGGTSLTMNDVYSVYNNPGAFGALDQTSIGINYENRFLLSELSTQSLAFGYHNEKSGNFGLHFQQYGFNLYREFQAGLAYGRQLADRFYGGMSVQFHSIQLGENYGSRNTASGSIGILYEASDDLQFGFRVQNVSRTSLAEYDNERLPTRFGLGMSYGFSEKVVWTLEAEKPILHPINIKSGLEIQPHEIINLRFGVNSYPFQSSFGFGLAFGKLNFDMVAIWNNQLGMSPSAGLKYEF